MSPENYLLAPSKQLYLLRVLGEEREGGVLTNETTIRILLMQVSGLQQFVEGSGDFWPSTSALLLKDWKPDIP